MSLLSVRRSLVGQLRRFTTQTFLRAATAEHSHSTTENSLATVHSHATAENLHATAENSHATAEHSHATAVHNEHDTHEEHEYGHHHKVFQPPYNKNTIIGFQILVLGGGLLVGWGSLVLRQRKTGYWKKKETAKVAPAH